MGRFSIRQVQARGIIGAPLLQIHTRLLRPAAGGDVPGLHTTVEEWRARTLLTNNGVQLPRAAAKPGADSGNARAGIGLRILDIKTAL